MMIAAGSIVQGNWSTIQYRADHVFQPKGKEYWCINGKDVNNDFSSGHFSYLGKRVGDEIMVNDPRRPDDRLLVIKEPKRKSMQMEFSL
jgi:hypothetical protein